MWSDVEEHFSKGFERIKSWVNNEIVPILQGIMTTSIIRLLALVIVFKVLTKCESLRF
jgi:hypothetical protein